MIPTKMALIYLDFNLKKKFFIGKIWLAIYYELLVIYYVSSVIYYILLVIY